MTHLRIDFDFGADATVESVQLLGATLTAEFGVPVAGPPGTTDYTQLINKPDIPQATSQTPVALGGFLALVGTSSEYARADHKHSIDATELRSHLNVADGAERNVNADWTATSGDAQILNKPSIPIASSTTPAALGTAAVGTGTTFARADHVHALPTASAIGAAATSHTQEASTISDSTPVGRSVLTAATQAAARAAIGAASDASAGFVQLTQAQFNALTAPNASTLYVIIG
jgi:hypothetical protein